MSTFIISYDLNKKKDYPKLYEAIKSTGSWCHALDSTWLVLSNNTSKQIADYLIQFIDADDEILVSKITKGSSVWRIKNKAVNDWLKVNG